MVKLLIEEWVEMFRFHIKQVIKFNYKNKFRLILAVLVIGLAISTMLTLNGLLDIFSKNITTTMIDQLPEADFSIQAQDDFYIYNTSLLSNQINTIDFVADTTSRYSIDAGLLLYDSNNSIFTIPTQIIAINLTKETEMNLGSFNPIVNSLQANECIVVGNFGKQLLKAQEKYDNELNVSMLLKPSLPVNLTLTIKAQAEQNKKFYTNLQNLIIIDYNTLEQFNMSTTATSLLGLFKDHDEFYSLDQIEQIDQLAIKRGSEIQDKIGYDYKVSLLVLLALSASIQDLSGQRLIINLIGLIMVLLSTILIYSIMNTSFKDLTHEYGIYKAIGLKDKWVFFNALINTFLIGILGLFAGFFLGFIFITLANSSLGDINVFVQINVETFIYIIVIGSIMILVSGLHPAYVSSKKNVLVAIDITRIESTDFQGRIESFRFSLINKKNIWRGFQLSSLGLLLFVLLPWLSHTFDQSFVNNIGILLIIMALIGFIFIISGFFGPLLQKILSKLFTFFFPKIGFATNLLLRKTGNKNTSNAIIFAISLAFVFFLNTLQATSINGSIYSLQRQVGSDLVLYAPQVNGESISKELYNFTKEYKGINSGFITTNGFYGIIGANIQIGDNIQFYSLRPAIYGVSKDLPLALMNEVGFYQQSNYSQIDDNNTIIISGSMARAFKVGIGDSLRIDVSSPIKANNEKYGKILQFTIVAIMKSLPGFPEISDNIEDISKAPVFIGKQSWQTIVKANPGFNESSSIVFEDYIQRILVKNNNADLNDFKNQIFLKFGSRTYIVDFQERLNTLLNNLQGSTLILTIILSFSTLIAFFAVITSTISYVNESKREIAVMKAIGLKEKEIKLIFTLQSVIISFTASLLGSFAGYLTGYLAEFNNSLYQDRPLMLVYPPVFVIFTFSLVIIFAIIGSYIPARKIYHIDTIKNLQ